MNDEWSRCPICFEDFSLDHRPTTFVCGHSTCIEHTIGAHRLLNCPICRHSLEQIRQYHVSYNLEEAARLFQAIKHTVDWSSVKLPSAPSIDDAQNSASAMIHRDEVYARRLQAQLNGDKTNRPRERAQARAADPTTPVNTAAAVPTTVPTQNQPVSHAKRCGHRCDLVSTVQCCTCSDRRPHRPNNRYEAYVDGHGMSDRVPRNEHYCSTCKRQ